MSKELADNAARLKVIERKLQSLEDQERALNKQQSKLLLRQAKLKHGVKIGSIVISDPRHGEGVEHRVTFIDTEYGIDRPWVRGNPRKKDGTFGAAVRSLYDNWRLVR